MSEKLKDSFSAYNPLINFVFFIGAIFLGMFITHPAYLAVSVIASVAYLLTIKGAATMRSLWRYAIIFMLVTLINPLFNTAGETVLFTVFGRNYTLEAIFYGMNTAAMLVSILLWFSAYNLIMTSDKFLYLFGKLIPGISLILTMVLRLVPSYQRKASQISTARMCIGKGADNEKAVDKVDNALTVLGTLTSWALEGGIITADSMRSRGYGSGERTTFSKYAFEMRDRILTAFMGVLILCVVYAGMNGASYVSYIPTVEVADISDFYGLLGIISYILFLSVPTIINIKERITWHILISKI
ncbi:MAG: energy-coupling factor transporter transmembrane protein EcfT [Anaerofustis stercorihominis]|nr:energy-coupling factor transporter transmembrane protein EcfT [Anaerofustis stercorihominis]